jgi:hypothetical protein
MRSGVAGRDASPRRPRLGIESARVERGRLGESSLPADRPPPIYSEVPA